MLKRFLFLLPLAALAAPAHAAVVGETATTKNDVTGQLEQILRNLGPGDSVSADELVGTGQGSATVIQFLDKSRLSIGASSKVTLDRFVFNPDNTAKSVIIDLSRGAMRFATGNSDPRNFSLKTPVATLGIRGTDVTLVCDGSGRCVFFVKKGKVPVCPHPVEDSNTPCPDGYDLDEINNFTFVGPNGVNSGPQQVSQSTIDAANKSIADGNFIDIAQLGNLPKFAWQGGPPPGGVPPILLGIIPAGIGVILLGSQQDCASGNDCGTQQ